MPDDVPNPYAPPVVAEPLATPGAGELWMVHGEHLLVRDGARLPPVSLLGEDNGSGLTSSQQVFAAASGRSTLVSLMPLLVMIGVMMAIRIAFDRHGLLEAALAFFVTSRLLRRFPKVSGLAASIQCFMPVSVLKARARRDRWRSRLIMASLTCFLLLVFGQRFGSAFFRESGDPKYLWALWFNLPMLAGVIGFFGVALVWGTTDSWLKCVSQTGGWFYLAGVPGSSLLKLSGMSAEPLPLRTRKVYTLYQYRLPLRILAGPRRNPLVILIIAILKLFRSPALVRQNFHWSERHREVKPDRDFAESIAKLLSEPEFASWQDLGCSRLDSPKGDLNLLMARFVSPDRRHFCHFTLGRISKARGYVEVSHTDFRTWTTDGCCLVTSSQCSFPNVPDYVEFRRVKGDAARVWSRHLQRCERVTPRVIESEDEVRRLLEKESEDHAERLRAARIQGPVEDVEMPGDWEDVVKAS